MEPQPKKRKVLHNVTKPEEVSEVPVIPEQQEVIKKEERRSLFVRSLPASITTERLTEFFSESFPLKHATVVLDPVTKISKGFGFVTFTDAEDAKAAVEQFNNSTLDGRKIKVELAQSRQRDTDDGTKSGPNQTAIDLKAKFNQQKEQAQTPRLIVRNLPWSVKEPEDLIKLFQSYGKVKHAVVPKKGGKAQYGFGIVVLRGQKNAEKAIAGVNGKEIDGRVLAVDWAVDKKTWEALQKSAADSEPQENGVNGEPAKESQAESTRDSLHTAIEDRVDSADVAEGASSSEDLDEDMVDPESDDQDPDEEDTASSVHSDDNRNTQNNTTIFIRNLPFTTDDDTLKEHFSKFGAVRYARVVYDQETERSRGTAFVCFFGEDDAKSCVQNAPKHEQPTEVGVDKKRRGDKLTHSILQNEATDPTGQYTLESRVLQVTRALNKNDADRRAEEASSRRDVRDRDKRRLYLLSEGTVSKSTKLYEQLGKAEIDIRESSARQRQKLIKTNPNLCLSLTRLSVRNLPRNIGSKELKALAREGVVGFTQDVKAGIREPLSREELGRGAQEMREAERNRKLKGVGIVKQAKIVFEGREGEKVKEGRSRGYGFIEYVSHRNALAGLRWLNGHLVPASNGEKGKRLIVEFAIENSQVIQRRSEREKQSREGGVREFKPRPKDDKARPAARQRDRKRKRGPEDAAGTSKPVQPVAPAKPEITDDSKNRLAKRNRIISRKRQQRKDRRN